MVFKGTRQETDSDNGDLLPDAEDKGKISNVYLALSAEKAYEPLRVTTICYDAAGQPLAWKNRFRLYAIGLWRRSW